MSAWFGANMKMNGYYNIKGGLQDYSTFRLDDIDVFGSDNRQNLAVDLYQTQIRLSTTYQHPDLGPISTMVEWDFDGGGGQMRLRKAYVKLQHWQIGQDWENFGNQDIWPNVLDFDGPPSGIWARVPFVKYFNQLRNPDWQWEVALQAPIVDYKEFADLAPTISYNYPKYPEFVAALRYNYHIGHVRLSAILRDISFKEDDHAKDMLGYGVSASGIVGDFGQSNFQFQYAIGKGIATYLVALGGSGYDAYPSTDGFKSSMTQGGWMSYEYYLNHKVHFNAVWGLTHLKMDRIAEFSVLPNLNNDEITTVTEGNATVFHNYIIFNALWDPYPNFTLGVEFDFGTKRLKTDGTLENDSGNTPFKTNNARNASRVSFGFMYNF